MKKDKLTIILDADVILQNIKQKYGEKTIITEKGKEAKEDILKNGRIWDRLPASK